MIKPNKEQYLWIRRNATENEMVIVDDPIALFRGTQFDENVDKLYRIGNEVKFKVTLEPAATFRTVIATQAISDELDIYDDPDGVGNYRG